MAETPRSRTSRYERFAAPTAAVLFALALFACGGAPEPAVAVPRVQEHEAHQRPDAVARTFDPSRHRADNIRDELAPIIRNIPPPASDQPEGTYDPTALNGSDSTEVVTNGYRVQLYMSTRRESAERAASIARQRFPEDSVYIVFQGAFHRVRIGDFRTEEEARAKVREAREKGYSEPLWLPPGSSE